MMHAYERSYLEKAQTALGRMLDYAVYDLKYDPAAFWEMFLASPVSDRLDRADVSALAGRSGVELALMVTGREKDYAPPVFTDDRSEVFWTGWALEYYHRQTGLTYAQITRIIPIEEIRALYSPYHEMDIRQFCDRMNEMYVARRPHTNLKSRRLAAGLSQSQLAALSGVPLRTLQQYEQAQKDIGHARAEYVIALARILCCEPRDILEYVSAAERA